MYEKIKDALKILNHFFKTKEYQEIIDLKKQIEDLKIENKELKEKLSFNGNLKLINNTCWNGEDGPLCSRCWDKNKETMHIMPIFLGSNISRCPECKTEVNVTGKNDTVHERPDYKLNKTSYK